MEAPTPIQDFQCPRCDAEVQADWACCPKCGTWLKAEGPFSYRVLAWLGVAVAFVSATALLSFKSQDNAIMFAVIFGIPLCYTFGKAVWFRLTGKPLTYRDLGFTSLRAFGVIVVLPFLVGMAAVVLLFVVCLGILSTGRM